MVYVIGVALVVANALAQTWFNDLSGMAVILAMLTYLAEDMGV